MTQEQLNPMRRSGIHPKVDAKSVKISCIDGVVLEGFVEHADDECHHVAFQMLVSSNPEKYEKGGCYAIRWEDSLDFQPRWSQIPTPPL